MNFFKIEEEKALALTSLSLRLGVGLLLAKVGLDHISATPESMFGKLVAGLPVLGAFPPSVAGAIELLLGLALILGLLTQIAAGLTAVFFFVTLVLVFPNFVGMATAGGVPNPLAVLFMLKDLMGLGASLGLFFLGFRGYGIDQFLKKK